MSSWVMTVTDCGTSRSGVGVLVALVIAFPKQVTMFLDKPLDIDLDKVKIELQSDTDTKTPQERLDENDEIQKSLGGKASEK